MDLPANWNFSSHAIPSLPLLASQVHEASYSCRPDILRFIFSKIPSDLLPRLLDSVEPTTSNTPLLWASMTGFFDAISLLVEAGSNLLVQNREGKTALHLAVASGSLQSVSYLVQAMWDLVKVGDEDGATPLHYAAVSFPQMVQLFSENKVSYRVVDHDGDTPVHWALRDGCLENVRQLVDYDPGLKAIPNSEGETVIQLAQLYSEKEIFEYLTSSSCESKVEVVVQPFGGNTFDHKTTSNAHGFDQKTVSDVWGFGCSHVTYSV